VSVLVGCIGYLFALIMCGQVFAAIGKANPNTIGDSWTGDDALDLWSLLLWPLSLVVLAAMMCGALVAAVIVRK
jgi:hypothetical protein